MVFLHMQFHRRILSTSGTINPSHTGIYGICVFIWIMTYPYKHSSGVSSEACLLYTPPSLGAAAMTGLNSPNAKTRSVSNKNTRFSYWSVLWNSQSMVTRVLWIIWQIELSR